MRSIALLAAAVLPMSALAVVGKSTYAMSHPWAYKTWMEAHLPVATNIAQQNNSDTCVEWVKLCVDDGSRPFVCQGPQGNTQLHSVGAYKRYSGTKSLEDLEMAFTRALGGMVRAVSDPPTHSCTLNDSYTYICR